MKAYVVVYEHRSTGTHTDIFKEKRAAELLALENMMDDMIHWGRGADEIASCVYELLRDGQTQWGESNAMSVEHKEIAIS